MTARGAHSGPHGRGAVAMLADDETVGDLVAAFLIKHDAVASLGVATTRDEQPWALRSFSTAYFSESIMRGEFRSPTHGPLSRP